MRFIIGFICSVISVVTFANNKLLLPKIFNSDKSVAFVETVSLSTVKEHSLYKVFCKLNNLSSNKVKLRFEPRLLSENYYGKLKINNVNSMDNFGLLNYGENILSFKMIINKQGKRQYNQINLVLPIDSQTQLLQCSANEIKPSRNAKNTSLSSNNNDDVGHYAYNKTNHAVTIGIGDYWPTEYKIEANSWRWIWATYKSKTLHILEIH